METLEIKSHETPVLIVGAGPVGMLTAMQLAHHGIKCMVAERNLETTRWPKMDISNCRSMELLSRLGLADELRKQGVPQNYSFDVIFSSGLSDRGEKITKWDLPSPDEWRTEIRKNNDGSMPSEPYQRCSQAVFEAWLKPIIDANPMIDCYFGLKFDDLEENHECVQSQLIDSTNGKVHTVKSKYVIACDGAGSRVRKVTKLNLTGGPVPAAMLLVHFKSRDLTKLQKQGQFWHIFFTNGGVIISQDEVDTWTVHLRIALDQDVDEIDARDAIFRVLGGQAGDFSCQIDEILVKSSWRPNLAVADEFRTKIGRVFLAGDSAHQNIPTGGYGMNTGIGDAYDIGWKLAAYLNGYGGEHLLDSYSIERRPVALKNVERSGVHFSVHATYGQWAAEQGPDLILSDTEAARRLKKKIAKYVLEHDGENKDHGIEMGYSFSDSPVIISSHNEEVSEPTDPRYYIPSTKPGVRAPHIYLADGETSVFQLYGDCYTVIDFTPEGNSAKAFMKVATSLHVPLKAVHLPDEPHAHLIWQRDVILVRPDGFVSWRSADPPEADLEDDTYIKNIILISVGQRASSRVGVGSTEQLTKVKKDTGGVPTFTSSIGNVQQDQGIIQKMGEFQM